VEPQIDAEGAAGQAAHFADLAPELVAVQAEAGEDAEPAGARHLGYERRTRNPLHGGLDDRVLDADQLAQGGPHVAPSCTFLTCLDRPPTARRLRDSHRHRRSRD
jgi:hypothetical protein